MMIGYFPSYYLGKLIKKVLPRTAELIVSAIFAVIFSIILIIANFLIDFHTNTLVFSVLIVIGIWSGWGAAFFGLWDKLKKKSIKAKENIDQAAQIDTIWNDTQMLSFANQIFLQYQYDWSTFNVQNMQTYMTLRYANHSKLLLDTLKELGRSNIMANVTIKNSLIIDMHDNPDDRLDTFTVAIEASALDQLVDTNVGNVLFSDEKPFTEYWKFVRKDSSWLLDNITQETQNHLLVNTFLQEFARENNMYYSLDMGWLFLPTRGLLVSSSKMGVSDINNHVVGTYNGHLVQLYTYKPNTKSNNSYNWLILQITLPKSYGGIIVQRDKKFFSSVNTYQKPTKEYKKYEFEWPDFNKRYDVHATNADRLAAFELINPGFMAYLYDNDPNTGIEVVDNTLYLYRYLDNNSTISRPEYQTMLTIALKAFKELKL